MSTITPAQIRGARGMLDWSLMDLARAAGVSVSTVKRIDDTRMVVSPDKVSMVQGALEAAGVEFFGDDEHGRGVRLTLRRDHAFSRFML
jgi:ribosome-binding protein aMBF1 (putative translation factor)